jgi:hypothetical protein
MASLGRQLTVRRIAMAVIVASLVVALATQVLCTIRQQSLTWDEGDHIFAGYALWTRSDYGMNPEHPPLVKLLATLPLVALPLHVAPPPSTSLKGEAYLGGRELLFRNNPPYTADTLIWRARLMAGLFCVALALLVFLAGREMFGAASGVLAMALWVFDPNVLAHGAFVTTDTALSCMLFATVYAFYRYVKAPTLGRLVLTGIAAGLALASKHSAILLLPILGLLAVCELTVLEPATGRTASRGAAAWRLTRALLAMAAVAVVALWAVYGFRYAARPAGMTLEPSLANYAASIPVFEARVVRLFARWHLLPESWLYGLLDVAHAAKNSPSYLLGRLHAHGVWFYFPVLFLIKTTLGLLALLGVAVWASLTGRLIGPRRRPGSGARHRRAAPSPAVAIPVPPGRSGRVRFGAARSALDRARCRAPGGARRLIPAGLPELSRVLQRAVGWPQSDVPLRVGFEHRLGAGAQSGPRVSGSARHQGLLDCLRACAADPAGGLRHPLPQATVVDFSR